MDSGSLIIGAVLIAICIVPFLLIGRHRKMREKKMIKSLKSIADNHKSKIGQSEICGGLAIGLDESGNFLYFYHQNKEIYKNINLSEYQNCKTIISKRIANNYISIISKIELKFTAISKNNDNIFLKFYDEDEKMNIDGEIKLVESWEQIINNKIKIIRNKEIGVTNNISPNHNLKNSTLKIININNIDDNVVAT